MQEDRPLDKKGLGALSTRPTASSARLKGSLRLQAALARGGRVADAIQEAGFGSESRVYEDTGKLLGMTPGALRRGGAGEVVRTAFADHAEPIRLALEQEKRVSSQIEALFAAARADQSGDADDLAGAHVEADV
jgi:hypothetical protein